MCLRTYDLTTDERAALKNAAELFAATQAAASLISGGAELNFDDLGAGAKKFLLRDRDCPDIECLKRLISDAARRIETLINHHIGLS